MDTPRPCLVTFPRAPSRRLRPVLLVALLALACGGEGGGGSGPPTRARTLELAAAPDAAPPQGPQTVLSDEVVRNVRSHWRIMAEEQEPGVLPDSDVPCLWVRNRGQGVMRLLRLGDYDSESFDQIELVWIFEGAASLVVDFIRDGERVTSTEPLELISSPLPQTITIEKPEGLKGLGAFEGIAFQVRKAPRGGKRFAAFVRVDLERVPDASRMPDVGDGAGTVRVGTESRGGVALASGRPLESRCRPVAGERLAYAYGRVDHTTRPAPGTELVLTLRSGETIVRELRHELDTLVNEHHERWVTHVTPLDDLAGHDLTLRFAIHGDPGPAPMAVALATPRLVPAAGAAPTVVLVTSDTHRADHVGALDPDSPAQTPVLDSLAAEGVIFTDVMSPTNVTNPSHGALLTGTHLRDFGILNNNVPLAEAATTLADVFREAGYTTAAAVSAAHLGHPISGLGQGFDRMSWPGPSQRDSAETLDVVEGWLEELGGQPLFLWVHLFDAHTPYAVPEPFDRMYYEGPPDPFSDDLPETGLPLGTLPPDMRHLRVLDYAAAQYGAEITYEDDQLARLVDLPRVRDGILAVVADHGESLGEHEVYFGHHQVHPQTVQIPMLLRWPGAPAGTRVDAPLLHTDLARTLIELAGLDAADFPGRSLLPLIEGQRRPPEPRFILSANAHSAAVEFDGLFLLMNLRTHQPRTSPHPYLNHEVELYDLVADPEATTNVVEERFEDARRLRARLVEWLRQAPSLNWAEDSLQDPELLKELEQLGYTGAGDTPEAGAYWTDDDCEICQRFEGD